MFPCYNTISVLLLPCRLFFLLFGDILQKLAVEPFFAIENYMDVQSWYFSAFSTAWPESKCLWKNQKSSLAVLQCELYGPEQEPSREVRKEICSE